MPTLNEGSDALDQATLLGRPRFLSAEEMPEIAKKQGRSCYIEKHWSYYVNRALIAGPLSGA